MNLQEQISKMKSMMGVINEDKKTDFIYKNFDKVFDKLKLIKTMDDVYQYNWLDKNGDKVFERNHWGMLWIYNCDEYDYLKTIPKMLDYSDEQFEKELLYYLNNRYSKEFGDKRPLRLISSEECFDF